MDEISFRFCRSDIIRINSFHIVVADPIWSSG